MNSQSSNEVPKVADFLGVGKSENQSDLAAFNEIQSNDSGYLFTNSSLVPMQNSVVAASGNFDYQENNSANSNLQSLTLSMGSGKDSTCETSGDNTANTAVEAAAPRRTLDTFGQRTSIYRGVTRWDLIISTLVPLNIQIIIYCIQNYIFKIMLHFCSNSYVCCTCAKTIYM